MRAETPAPSFGLELLPRGESVTTIAQACDVARRMLLAERGPDGHWTGRLSSSALSTATAVTALAASTSTAHATLVAGGVRWLAANQNADGGWGDTVDSPSNLSTTLLARAAAEFATDRDCIAKADAYLARAAGPTREDWIRAIREAYGKDRTFSVPILTDLAIAGLIDWKSVPTLPFEFARLPRSWFRFMRLHVVSYALPALIAIGQAAHAMNPTRCPVTRFLRRRAVEPTLALLERIQPSGGGFLEATPLTSFVVMSLAAADRAQHPVARRGVEFLARGVRPDGSWPIDTNLATWLTTQALDSLGPESIDGADAIRAWLLAQQWRTRHVYTDSAPGGWAWTDLPGGVSDADDTPGALIALVRLGVRTDDPAVVSGVRWLLDLQNSDGGWPTFCRGWGKLPFDRSTADLTAHAVRALSLVAPDHARASRAIERGFKFLMRTQSSDGSWTPLWFGNQHTPGKTNPVYGTARALVAYAEIGQLARPEASRAAAYLISVQNPDGGWGGAKAAPSTTEETALAVRALASGAPDAAALAAARSGGEYLARRISEGGLAEPAPIGLYFSVLWYSEKLYPAIWSVGALRALLAHDEVRA